MTFRLRRLRLIAQTSGGPYGADIRFADGLNILAAPNTSGKSTCVQAILFALGLEGMLGPGREVPLPHAMTQYLHDEAGREQRVTSSHVWLEIEDDNGQPLTLRRPVVERGVSNQLVSVWESTIKDLAGSSRDFFVRRNGAAQRIKGPHQIGRSQIIGANDGGCSIGHNPLN